MKKTVFNKIVAGILFGSMVFSQPAVYADSSGTSSQNTELIEEDSAETADSDETLISDEKDSSDAEKSKETATESDETVLIDEDSSASESSAESDSELVDDSPVIITGWEENPIQREGTSDTAPEDSEALTALFPDSVEAETNKGTTVVPIAKWSAEDYEKTAGTYTLTAELEDGYKLGEGVSPLTGEFVLTVSAAKMRRNVIRRAPAASSNMFEETAVLRNDLNRITGGLGNVKNIQWESSAPASGYIDVGYVHHHSDSCYKKIRCPASGGQPGGNHDLGLNQGFDVWCTWEGTIDGVHYKCNWQGHNGPVPAGSSFANMPEHYLGTINVCGMTEGQRLGHIYAWFTSDGTLHFYNAVAGSTVYTQPDASGMFSGFSALTSLDLSQINFSKATNTTNMFAGDSSLSSITLNSTFRFTNTKASGLTAASYPKKEYGYIHKEGEVDEVETNLGLVDGAALVAIIDEKGAESAKQTFRSMGLDDATINKVMASQHMGQNYRVEGADSTGATTGFETMFNADPGSMAGTWIMGLSTSHRYWKQEGVGKYNAMSEIHHPEAPFTTYCWAQHRGPNSGWYDRYEVTNEKQMLANLQVYHQNYGPIPSERGKGIDARGMGPMMRSFITVMYYGDVNRDPLGLRRKYNLTNQQFASITQSCVGRVSDGGGSIDGTSGAMHDILSQSFDNIPNKDSIHFYIYLSTHDGGGQQQMGVESIQYAYYGGIEFDKADSFGNGLPGAEFTLTSADGSFSRKFVTDANGEVHACKMDEDDGIPVGNGYTLRETKAPVGYELCNDVYTVNLYRGRVSTTGYKNGAASKSLIHFVDTSVLDIKYGTITVNKTSATAGKGLSGAEFKVFAASDIVARRLYGDGTVTLYRQGDEVETAITNYAGTAVFRVPTGSYLVKETKAPGGYKIDVKEGKTAEVQENGNAVLGFTDTPKNGSFTVRAKKDVLKGYPLKAGSFTFHLYQLTGRENSDGTPEMIDLHMSARNKADGSITFREMSYDAESNLTYTSDDGQSHTIKTNFAGEVDLAILEEQNAEDTRYTHDSHTEYVFAIVQDNVNDADNLVIVPTYSSDDDSEDAKLPADDPRRTGELGSFHNTFNKAPEIPAPYKRVSKGTTIEEGIHNSIYAGDTYQYDVYQQIPAEKKASYFKSFVMTDVLPAYVTVDPETVKVYASGADDTKNWKITVGKAQGSNPAQIQITASYIGNLDSADAYGKLYDFRYDAVSSHDIAYICNEVMKLYNHARVDIVYNDPEEHFVLDKDGNVTSASDGAKVYEAENPYDNQAEHGLKPAATPDENGANGKFSTKTTNTSAEAVHSATTNEVITEVVPYFPDYTWEVKKREVNENGADINLLASHPGDIITYYIDVTNKTKSVDGTIQQITDKLSPNVTFISADNGGTMNKGIVVWKNLDIKPGTTTVSVTVSVNKKATGSIDNNAVVTVIPDNGNKPSSKTTNKVHNFVPEIVKVVTDGNGNNINGEFVPEGTVLYYHLFVKNGDAAGEDPARSGRHEIRVIDEIPDNCTLLSAAEQGTKKSVLPKAKILNTGVMPELTDVPSDESIEWTELFEPQEVREYVFTVKTSGKSKLFVNTGKMYIDPNGTPDDPDTPVDPKADSDRPFESNKVTNATPADPVKDVRLMDDKTSVDHQFLQVGDTYEYVITVDNPSAFDRNITVTDLFPIDKVKIIAIDDGRTVNDEKEPEALKLIPVNKALTETASKPGTHSYVNGTVTWVSAFKAGETKAFTVTFIPTVKNTGFRNQAHTHMMQRPIDPDTGRPIQGSNESPFDQDTNTVVNWTPADPVKTVTRTNKGIKEPQNMDGALVWGANEDRLDYTITFHNNSDETKKFVITDCLDGDLAYANGTASDGGSYDEGTRTVTWTLNLKAGEEKTVSFSANVSCGNTIASGDNFANMVVENAYPNSNTTDTDIDETPVKSVYDKDGKDINTFLVNPDSELTYVIRVKNPDEQTKRFTVEDVVPDHTELVSAEKAEYEKTDWCAKEKTDAAADAVNTLSVADRDGNALSEKEYAGAGDGTKLTWTFDIPSGESWKVSFKVKTLEKDIYVPNSAIATVDQSSIRTNLVENWTPEDPLKAVTEDGKDINEKVFFLGDENVYTYEITQTNPANVDKEFTITDYLNRNLKFVSATDGGKIAGRKVTWNITIGAGQTKTVGVTVQIAKQPDSNKITNTAHTASDEWESDTNTVVNYVTDPPVKEVKNLQGADIENRLRLVDGQHKYIITWKNPTETDQVYDVSDTLQDGITFVSADNNGRAKDRTVTWKNIKVKAGESGSVSFVVSTDASLRGKELDNKATVNYHDNPELYRHDTNVVKLFYPEFIKSVTDGNGTGKYAELVSPGDTLVYELKITNPSGVKQKIDQISDTLPNGVAFISAGNGGTASGQTVTFEDLIIPKEGLEIPITVRVTESAEGSIINKFSGKADDTKDESNTVINFVLPAPVKAVMETKTKKDADKQTVVAGTNLTYSITVKNTADRAKDFTVTDKIDSQLKVTKVNNKGKLKDGVITWNFTLNAGEERTITFRADAPNPKEPATVTNKATVTVDKTKRDTNEVLTNVSVKYPAYSTDSNTSSNKNTPAVTQNHSKPTGDAGIGAGFIIGMIAAAAVIGAVIVKKRKHRG